MRRVAVAAFPLLMLALTARRCLARPLTFEERVQAQEAVERVFWEHRIWPSENPDPKPAFEQTLSPLALRARIREAIRQTRALDIFFHRPIRPADLQAEMNRIAAE